MYKPFRRRRLYFIQQNGLCFYCDRPLTPYLGYKYEINFASFDHMVPKCRGGRSTWKNICVACNWCNDKKTNMSVTEFLAYLTKVRIAVLNGSKKSNVFISQKFLEDYNQSVITNI